MSLSALKEIIFSDAVSTCKKTTIQKISPAFLSPSVLKEIRLSSQVSSCENLAG